MCQNHQLKQSNQKFQKKKYTVVWYTGTTQGTNKLGTHETHEAEKNPNKFRRNLITRMVWYNI